MMNIVQDYHKNRGIQFLMMMRMKKLLS